MVGTGSTETIELTPVQSAWLRQQRDAGRTTVRAVVEGALVLAGAPMPGGYGPTDPVAAFLRDRCVFVDPAVLPGVRLDAIHAVFVAYRTSAGASALTKDVFARSLRREGGDRVVVRRQRVADSTQVQMVYGIALR